MKPATEVEEIVVSKAAKRNEVMPMARTEPAAVVQHSQSATVLSMLQTIMTDPTVSIERVNQAFDFYQRVEKADAKKSFDAAMALAQAEFPPIVKNRRVKFDSRKAGSSGTDYRHEDLAEIVEKCRPVLAKHGITVRWRTQNEIGQPIVVTCMLTHRAGHTEENTLCGPRDESGNKNGLQGIASTVTYLERYTFKSAAGLASAHDDDDGKAGGAAPRATIDEEQLKNLRAKMETAKVEEQIIFERFKVETLEDLTPDDYTTATARLDEIITLRNKP